jgi:hypothetical protein
MTFSRSELEALKCRNQSWFSLAMDILEDEPEAVLFATVRLLARINAPF